MEHNMVSKMSTLLRMGLVSKNNVRRATMLLKNPEKAMSNPAYRTLMQDILVDIMDRILNSKALYAAVRQNLVREPMVTTEGVEEDRTKTLLRSGLVPKKDIMVARRALSSPAKAKSMATVRAYRELMIDLLDSMVGKITGSPTLYNAFKQTMGKKKVEDMEESFEQPNEDTIAELLLHETAQELMEKNKPTKPDLWAQAKSKAKSKFKVYPSAYANGWAVKWYNEQGGGWKSVNEGKTFFGLRDELDEANSLDAWTQERKIIKAREEDKAKRLAQKRKLNPLPRPKGVPEKKEMMESEYKEVLTGYPNRGMNNDYGSTDHRNPEYLAQANAVLKAIGRYTFNTPSEAFLRIKTRLNLLMLDFPWTPYAWKDGGTGTTVLNVTRYGRVDGVDANTGEVRMDGRASPTDGFLEFNLVAQTEMADDGFYRVTARLEPKSEIGLPLSVKEEVEQLDEVTGSEVMMYTMASFVMLYPTMPPMLIARFLASKAAEKFKGLISKVKSNNKISPSEKDTLKSAIKGINEEIEQLDEAGQAKLERLGKAYDKARIGSRGVLNPENKKRLGDAYFKMRDKVLDKRKKRIESGTFDKEAEVKAVVAKNRGTFGKVFGKKTVKEELIGGQKRLDVNKNKKLDAQDFKLLRAKKKPVQEEIEKRLTIEAKFSTNDLLDSIESAYKKGGLRGVIQGGRQFGLTDRTTVGDLLDSAKSMFGSDLKKAVSEIKGFLKPQDYAKYKSRMTVNEAKMKQWTPRLDKLVGSSRDAVRIKPKKRIERGTFDKEAEVKAVRKQWTPLYYIAKRKIND